MSSASACGATTVAPGPHHGDAEEDVATLAMPSVRPQRQPGADPRSRRARDDLGEGDIVRLFEARGPTSRPSRRRPMRCARTWWATRSPMPSVRNINYTKHLLLPLRLLRLLQGQARGQPARLALRSHDAGDVRRASEAWTAAPPKSACKAASIRIHRPALPRRPAAPCRGDPGHAMSMPSRRSRFGTRHNLASRSPTT